MQDSRNSLNLDMEKLNRIEKEWFAVLEGSDPESILPVLYEIRNSGSVNILPVLFNMIHKKTDPQVRNEIINLLSEIKSQDAVPMIIASLEKHDFGDYLPAFVAACWQSGLNFSNHLRVFTGLFIQADYMTALESFTVIEESIPFASDQEKIACIHFLKDAEYMVTDEKMPLFRELRKVVEGS
jgi:hypothetical protein